MKIQAFSSFYQNKINNIKAPIYANMPLKADSLEIDFKGLKEKKLKLQALQLEKQAERVCAEASEIRQDSYLVQIQSREIKKDSIKILKNAQTVLKEALLSLRQGQMTNHETIYDKKTGKIARCFYEEDEYDQKVPFTMDDFCPNGKLRRRVVQEDGQLLRVIIPDENEKKYQIYLFDLESKSLLKYIESNDMADGQKFYNANRQFVFSGNKLTTYDFGYTYTKNKGEKSKEHFSYSNGQMSEYNADWSLSSDGSKETAQEKYKYNNGVLQKAQIGFVDVDGEYRKIEQEFLFDDEVGFKSCLLDFANVNLNPVSNVGLIFSFDDDGLKRIYSDVTIRKYEKRFDSAQMFLCVDEKAKRCAYNYSCIDKTKEIYSDLVKIGS